MYSTNITSDALSLSAFTVSSENASFPKANLQDVYLGRPFKFAGLFRITTANRDIKMTDTTSATTTTFQLTAGSNLTGATLASTLEALINAFSGFAGYTVAYSTTTGFSCPAGAPDGLFFVGTNLSSSAGVKVFSSASDLTGAISSGDTYQAHFAGAGTLEKTLTVNTDFGVDDFNDMGFVNLTLGSNVQYWYLSIVDPTPREDRVEQEIGRFGLGTLTKPDRAWAQAYNANLLDPSPLSDTFGGLFTGQSFPKVREIVVNWVEVTDALKDTIEAIYKDRPNPLVINGDISRGQQALYSQITNAPLTVRSSDPSRWNVGVLTFRQIPRRQV